MSKHKGVIFSVSFALLVFVIFTIFDLISTALTPERLLENFLICIIFFIIAQLGYSIGYNNGFEDANSENFDSYLTGFEAGCNFIVEHIDELEDELWPKEKYALKGPKF